MSKTCILVAGLDATSEYQLQRAWFAAHLRVPLFFRRTGEGAITYLAAIQGAPEINYPRPVMVVFNLPLVDMQAWLAVKQIRSERRFRELLLIACHSNWDLIEQRLMYSSGADSCIGRTDDFSDLIRQIRRVEDFWFKEPLQQHA